MIPVKLMRVVLAHASLGAGEEDLRILGFAEALTSRGHYVEIWAAAGSMIADQARRRGYHLRVLPLGKITSTGLLAVRRALRETRPDILNTHCSTDACLLALMRHSIRGSPPVVHMIHGAAPEPRNWLARWLYAHACGHVVTADEGLRARLLQAKGLRENRVTSIAGPTDARCLERIFAEVIEVHARRRRGAHARWERLKRSLSRRWSEIRLPSGYIRLGSRYGGWWLDRKLVRSDPLMVDCGLGQDISFDVAFLSRFAGMVVGVDPNPQSLDWCKAHCPPGMHLLDRAFWTASGRSVTFHLPRPRDQLPRGADGLSGSLIGSHEYVTGGSTRSVTTTDLEELLADAGRADCDVLKLDIEGAEYEVLPDLARRRLLQRCRQVLVEFHHGVTHHTVQETERVVEAVLSAGFRLIHVEGRNYIFRRSDLG